MASSVSFKRNAMWVLGGTTATVTCQFLTIIVLARILSPYEFGVVSAATLINQFALIFVEFGIGPYVVQRADFNRDFLATAYLMSCVSGVAVASLVFTFSPLLAGWLGAPDLVQVLKIYSVIFLIYGACAVHDGLTQRALDYRYLARADATSFIVGYAGISIISAVLGFSYWSLVMGHISQLAIRGGILRLRHRRISRGSISWGYILQICRFGFGQTLSRVASYIASQADSFVVASRIGVTAVGNYGRANQLVTMPAAQLGQIFDKLIFPYVSRAQHEHTRAATTYLNAVRGISILSLPASAIFWIFGEVVVNLLLGSQWYAVAEPLRVLALAIPFRLIHKVSDPTARAMGKTYSRAWRQWVVAVALIIFSLLLSPYGLAAVAWGVVAAAIIDAALMVWLCLAVTDFEIRQFQKAMQPGVFAGLIVYLSLEVFILLPGVGYLNNFLLLFLVGIVGTSIVAIFLRNFLKSLR